MTDSDLCAAYAMMIIDPYHAVTILDLKRGWTGINNVLKINYAF